MTNTKELIAEQYVDQSRDYETLLTQNYIASEYGEKGLKFILREIHNRYENLIKNYRRDVVDNKQDKVFTNGFDAWSLLKVCIDMEHEHKLKRI
ncbi:MAG TPA: hypothetical protein ENI25_03100 [Epsilonproteobacteria bacterium]|nr:hypothetical protein [Campylobacterota bacterium]